ncbi:T cell receptor gamma variable 3 [Camelus dromedarius]|nr:T cell receptor gamma variable 3 [Camelus dromedarius]
MGPSTPAGCRALLGCLALLWALPVPSDQEEVRLVQPALVMARTRGSTTLPCRTYGSVTYVHWYRQLEGRAPERLLYLALSKRDVQWDSVLRGDKVNAQVNNDGRSCFLSLMKLEKADEGTYYCAAWDAHSPARRPGPCTKSTGTHWSVQA